MFNPLTPVLPVTARDEPWPFFLFWHHFWPKLAPSILNFCSRKQYFQWCPDQSDRLSGALDMQKKAQKVEWKTQSKISCHYTWLLHAKNCLSRWRFLRSFLTASKPSRRSMTAAKRREMEKKERRKKIPKIEKFKDIDHFNLQKRFQNFDFCPCPSHSVLKRDAGGKRGKLLCCKRVFDWSKGNLAEIQLKNDQNVQKTPFLQKVPAVYGLNNNKRTQWVLFLWDPQYGPQGEAKGNIEVKGKQNSLFPVGSVIKCFVIPSASK